MNAVLDSVLADLTAEGDALEATLAHLSDEGWATSTPAAGWNVAAQIGHLAWTDEVATLAAHSGTPDGKQAWDAVVLQAIEDPTGFVDAEALRLADLAPQDLLAHWRAARPALASTLRELPPGEKMPWFGPPMSATSMATARLMETWAHGLDVAAALGIEPERTDRIRNVVHLAVRTRDFAYTVHELDPPTQEFRIEVAAPSGEIWEYGPEDATQRVTGSAWDLCLLATQRIHRDDTDLVAEGADAEHWLSIAQCFAGPAGGGRESAA